MNSGAEAKAGIEKVFARKISLLMREYFEGLSPITKQEFIDELRKLFNSYRNIYEEED